MSCPFHRGGLFKAAADPTGGSSYTSTERYRSHYTKYNKTADAQQPFFPQSESKNYKKEEFRGWKGQWPRENPKAIFNCKRIEKLKHPQDAVSVRITLIFYAFRTRGARVIIEQFSNNNITKPRFQS